MGTSKVQAELRGPPSSFDGCPGACEGRFKPSAPSHKLPVAMYIHVHVDISIYIDTYLSVRMCFARTYVGM